MLCLGQSVWLSQLPASSRREVSDRGSGSISLALPCLGPGLGGGLVMQWELPELDFSALPATSKKNCRTHEVRHATKTGGAATYRGSALLELTAAALAGRLDRLCKPCTFVHCPREQILSIETAASTPHPLLWSTRTTAVDDHGSLIIHKDVLLMHSASKVAILNRQKYSFRRGGSSVSNARLQL